jgi:alcohol dehydrogenase class IV
MKETPVREARDAARADQELFFGQSARAGMTWPTRLIWGDGCAARWLEQAAGRVPSRCLVVCDPAVRGREPVESLREALGPNAAWLESGEMPEAAWVDRYARELEWDSIGWVVAFGGGSAIDSAKALLGEHLFEGGYGGVGMGSRRGQLPREDVAKPLFVAVPSTAGSGAETSRYLVCYDKSGDRWRKVHGKSWHLVADVAVLDPRMLLGAPDRVIVEPAFDAFVHACESALCQGEANQLTRGICYQAIEVIGSVIGHVGRPGGPVAEELVRLQVAASTAGIAISNARTGHIHEAGGAALEWCTGLTHALTLWVFAREGFAQTARTPAGREGQATLARAMGCESMEQALDRWSQWLEEAGSLRRVEESLAALSRSGRLEEAQASVVRRVADDTVWCTKESPSRITEEDAEAMAACLEAVPHA